MLRGTTHIHTLCVCALIGGATKAEKLLCFNAAIRTRLLGNSFGASTRKGCRKEVLTTRFHQMRALCKSSLFGVLRHSLSTLIVYHRFYFLSRGFWEIGRKALKVFFQSRREQAYTVSLGLKVKICFIAPLLTFSDKKAYPISSHRNKWQVLGKKGICYVF